MRPIGRDYRGRNVRTHLPKKGWGGGNYSSEEETSEAERAEKVEGTFLNNKHKDACDVTAKHLGENE